LTFPNRPEILHRRHFSLRFVTLLIVCDCFATANNIVSIEYSQVEIEEFRIRNTTVSSAADVQEMLKEDLLYDGVVHCFSRKWRLLVVGHNHDYTHTPLQLEHLVLINVIAATVLVSMFVLFIIVQSYKKMRLSETMISVLDVQVITDRAKADNKLSHVAHDLRTLIDTANAPIFGVDNEGRVNKWNKKSVELTGHEYHEVMGRDLVQEFIAPEYRSAVKEVLENALKGLVTSSFEFTLFSKAGVAIELLLNANPRRNATGDIVGVINFGQDITAKRKAMGTEVDLSKVISKFYTQP
jgi:PAS domain S-box-containing protein